MFSWLNFLLHAYYSIRGVTKVLQIWDLLKNFGKCKKWRGRIMPDGSAFKFSKNKNTDQEAQRGVPKGSLANATRSVSKNSIHNSSQKVNNKNKKTAEDLHFPANPRHPYR